MKRKILVDADGCPVVKIAIDLAREYQLPIILVKNHAHVINDDYAQIVTVDTTSDSADFYIVNHTSKGDVVITQDNGLAAMCLGKGALVINQNGLMIHDGNIEGMLSSRHVHRELRSRGIYASKAKKRQTSSNRDFELSFRNLLEEVTGHECE